MPQSSAELLVLWPCCNVFLYPTGSYSRWLPFPRVVQDQRLWMSRRRSGFICNSIIDCCDGTLQRNLFWSATYNVRSSCAPSLKALNQRSSTPTTSSYLSKQSDKLFCLEPRWVKVPDSCRCPFPRHRSFFFYFRRMWSDRRVAIFGACCGGCFYLAHPSGLVFKPWPTGSGMMRTLFQSPPPPLKALQSSAWTQKIVSISNEGPLHCHHFELKFQTYKATRWSDAHL